MLGDTGVAVHPDDKRYAALIKAGAKVKLPLVGREIPIVADEYSDPEKGTGAVKITPAHDFNDFEVGKRHGLEQINVLDAEGRINDDAPEAYRGLDRFEARKQIVADLEALGLLEKIEPTTHTVPHGDRSNVVIEPWLTDQWYVNAAELAKPAIAAVESGKTDVRAEELGEDLLRMDAQHPALVHLAPAVVGPPDPGVVRSRKSGNIWQRTCRSIRRKRRFSSADFRRSNGRTGSQGRQSVLPRWHQY